jgi:hypothetical protein
MPHPAYPVIFFPDHDFVSELQEFTGYAGSAAPAGYAGLRNRYN